MNITRDRASLAHSAVFFILASIVMMLTGCGDDPVKPPASPAPPKAPVHRGVDFLLSKQSADGGWHSQTYGQLKGGVANTALIVYALAHLPADERKPIQPQIDRAIAFLLKGLDEQGFIRHADGSADYPTYATAMLVTALHRMEMTAAHKPAIERMVDYLKRSQQTTRQGWKKTDPDFGGWNQTGGEAADAKIEGQTNIAITSIALEALQASAMDDDVKEMALHYAGLCQRSGTDGFYFTSRPDHFLNKAGTFKSDDHVLARAYGTATADGLAALLACEVPGGDKRVQLALAWLARHPAIDRVPYESPADQPAPSDTDFAEGLRFYYAFALARAMRMLPPTELADLRASLRNHLVKQQQPDGSWRNANTMMREDDPLIATAMAVAALAMTR